MQDAITAAITTFDQQGQYLDSGALSELEKYFQTGQQRVQTASLVSEHAADIVREAVAYFLSDADPREAQKPIQTTYRYAACVRDLDFYLRYATYAMVAGDTSILDERVLDGLKETYQSLGVSITTTIQSVKVMKAITIKLLGEEAGQEMGTYLDYICESLA